MAAQAGRLQQRDSSSSLIRLKSLPQALPIPSAYPIFPPQKRLCTLRTFPTNLALTPEVLRCQAVRVDQRVDQCMSGL